MKSRFLFREHGQVIHIRRGARLANVLASLSTLGVMAALLGLLAWGHAVDEQTQVKDTYEAGLAVGAAQMQETVAEAYRQGRRDVLAAGLACPPAPGAQREHE